MAQLTGRTDLTAIDDYVLAELISAKISAAVQTPFIGMQICWVDSIDGPSRTKAYPIISNITAASAVSETDEVGYTALASSEITVTATLKASAAAVSDQAQSAGQIDSYATAVDRCLNACQQKVEADVLALFTSISASQGNNAVVNDFENYQSVMAAVRAAMKAPSMVAYVAHPDQMRDLRQDMATNGAGLFGSAYGAQMAAQLGGVQQGAKGVLFEPGVMGYETDGVPAGDTTGWTGAVIELGNEPGLVMAYVPRIAAEGRIVSDGGLFAVARDYIHNRFTNQIIASVDYGVAIRDQSRCYKFISRT